MHYPDSKPQHLDFAATNDDTTIIIVKNGGIHRIVNRAEVGDGTFTAVLDALANQQSLDSIELLLA